MDFYQALSAQKDRGTSLYSKVANIVSEYLQNEACISASSVIKGVRDAIKINSIINYDELGEEFAVTFWERNFWKAAYFFECEFSKPAVLSYRSRSSVDILVLGVGSAADCVACLAWLEKESPCQKVILTLIDRSSAQLELAGEIIELARRVLCKIDVDISYLHLAIGAWEPVNDSADFVLMSHVLTENQDHLNQIVTKTISALRPQGELLIIERKKDSVWKKAMSILSMHGVTTHDLTLSDEKFPLFTRFMPVAENDMTPYYVRGYMPEANRLRELVEAYFIAWKERTAEPLADIFTKTASYEEKPGVEAPIVGIGGIQTYWDRHPGLQRNIVLSVHNVTYSPTVAVCSFSGSFDTQKQHIDIQGAINFFLDPRQEKFHRLTEYFGTVKTPFNNR